MVEGYVIDLDCSPHPNLPPQAGEGATPSLARRAGEGWGGGENDVELMFVVTLLCGS